MRSNKSRIPDPPDWVWQIKLAQHYNVLPSAIDEEPAEWVARLIELYYQENRQGSD